MSKEMPFKSIKITLSDEALRRLESIVKDAAFRSYSSGVEECIRGIYDIIQEMYALLGRENVSVSLNEKEMSEAFVRIGMRMTRFTGFSPLLKTKLKTKEEKRSADT